MHNFILFFKHIFYTHIFIYFVRGQHFPRARVPIAVSRAVVPHEGAHSGVACWGVLLVYRWEASNAPARGCP